MFGPLQHGCRDFEADWSDHMAENSASFRGGFFVIREPLLHRRFSVKLVFRRRQKTHLAENPEYENQPKASHLRYHELHTAHIKAEASASLKAQGAPCNKLHEPPWPMLTVQFQSAATRFLTL